MQPKPRKRRRRMKKEGRTDCALLPPSPPPSLNRLRCYNVGNRAIKGARPNERKSFERAIDPPLKSLLVFGCRRRRCSLPFSPSSSSFPCCSQNPVGLFLRRVLQVFSLSQMAAQAGRNSACEKEREKKRIKKTKRRNDDFATWFTHSVSLASPAAVRRRRKQGLKGGRRRGQ